MNPLRWPFRAQFFLGFLICAGLLGYAIFLQLKMGLPDRDYAAAGGSFVSNPTCRPMEPPPVLPKSWPMYLIQPPGPLRLRRRRQAAEPSRRR